MEANQHRSLPVASHAAEHAQNLQCWIDSLCKHSKSAHAVGSSLAVWHGRSSDLIRTAARRQVPESCTVVLRALSGLSNYVCWACT